MIEALGARGVVADAFDADALRRAVVAAKPDVVIHQLTDLPDVSDPAQMAVVREKNARLRIEGTRNLMAAAKAAGVRRVVAQSIAFIYAPGPKPHREDDPLDQSEAQRMTIAGVMALEDAVLNTPGIDGIVLRYGRLYGPGTWFDKPGGPGPLTADAAAQAALLARHARRAGHLQHRRGRRRVLDREGPARARLRSRIPAVTREHPP